MEKITQTDIDNLADILWWIKGYKAGADADFNSCPFCMDHYESLRKSRSVLLDMNGRKTQESEESVNSSAQKPAQQTKAEIPLVKDKLVRLMVDWVQYDNNKRYQMVSECVAELSAIC